MTTHLELRGVRFRYPGATSDAVAGLDLAVAADETVCVLGASGSGKSTLLRLVAGLEAPTGGTVAIDGVDQEGVPPHRRDVAMLFQSYALFPHRDVGGNVAYGLQAHGVAREETRRRVADALASVGLDGWQERPVDTLSGGEAQRVALARALVLDPPLLLLDEPLGALDRAWRDDLIGRFRDIFRGRCVVHVTHDQSEALALADRVAVMHDGRIVQCGTTSEVWGAPADASVARLVGLTGLHDARLLPAGPGRQQLHLPWCTFEIPATTLASGDVTVMVRPDAWKLTECASSRAAPSSSAQGVVVDDRFAGDRRVVSVALVRTGDGEARTDILDVHLPTDAPWRAGDDVAVAVDPSDVLVLPS